MRDALAQIGEHSATPGEACRALSTVLLDGQIDPTIDDLKRGFPGAGSVDSASRELIGEHEPERRVVFIAWVAGGRRLELAEDVDQLCRIERESCDSPDGGTKVHREVARVEAGTPGTHLRITVAVAGPFSATPPRSAD
jgi:hypothetical protein